MTATPILIADGVISPENVVKDLGSLAQDQSAGSVIQLDNVKTYTGSKASDAILVVGDVGKLVSKYQLLGSIADKVLSPGGKLKIKFTTALSSENQALVVRKIKYSGFTRVEAEGDWINGETEKQVWSWPRDLTNIIIVFSIMCENIIDST